MKLIVCTFILAVLVAAFTIGPPVQSSSTAYSHIAPASAPELRVSDSQPTFVAFERQPGGEVDIGSVLPQQGLSDSDSDLPQLVRTCSRGDSINGGGTESQIGGNGPDYHLVV